MNDPTIFQYLLCVSLVSVMSFFNDLYHLLCLFEKWIVIRNQSRENTIRCCELSVRGTTIGAVRSLAFTLVEEWDTVVNKLVEIELVAAQKLDASLAC